MNQNHKQDEIDNEDSEEYDGSLQVNGPFGTGVRLPSRLVDGIIPAFARWVVPAIAIAIGVSVTLWGISQIVRAWRMAA